MIRDYAFIVKDSLAYVFDSEESVRKAVDGMNGKEIN
mgnify:CR=1 FL=1